MQALAIETSTPQRIKPGPTHAQVPSVDACIEIVGAAIVNHVRNDIGLNKARTLARKYRSQRLYDKFFRSVITDCAFSDHGIKKIYLFAEVLGIDPNAEVSRAYANPATYFDRCKRLRIEVPRYVRDILNKQKPIQDRSATASSAILIRERDAERTSYSKAIEALRAEIYEKMRRPRRQATTHDDPPLLRLMSAA